MVRSYKEINLKGRIPIRKICKLQIQKMLKWIDTWCNGLDQQWLTDDRGSQKSSSKLISIYGFHQHSQLRSVFAEDPNVKTDMLCAPSDSEDNLPSCSSFSP